MIEEFKQCLAMQKELDKYILEKNGIHEYPYENIMLALLDEVGELTHELKPQWCYWKHNMQPISRERVLEELVDVFHFLLSLYNYSGYSYVAEYDDIEADESRFIYDLSMIPFFGNTHDGMIYFFRVSKVLGFRWEDIFRAYKQKQTTNYARQHNGY